MLATEGINFFLAGTATAVEGFTAFLDGDERFHGIPVKTSFTDYPPFNRLNVRKKSEIISVGLDHINPAILTGPEIETPGGSRLTGGRGPSTGRKRGTIGWGTPKAIDLDIRTFRGFPKAIQRLPATMKDEPVVMFYGGDSLRKNQRHHDGGGVHQRVQLKGGVLGYFEEVWGGPLGRRLRVRPAGGGQPPLERETQVVVCFACREPPF
ncbi:MAG: hypothetical protein CM15mP78_06300 [Candidatus Poseidoniales archaeon]|nr:MAG: hypothetical protein CM15mP78_06300 [Candidatus Poseidoniales archaeon]